MEACGPAGRQNGHDLRRIPPIVVDLRAPLRQRAKAQCTPQHLLEAVLGTRVEFVDTAGAARQVASLEFDRKKGLWAAFC
jgi:hypothetical protein